MPAYLAHYTCGVYAQRHLGHTQLNTLIREHRHAWQMGLAGPDLFFYSVIEATRPGMTIGRAMHKYRTGAFLRSLYRCAFELEGKEREIALAYFAGFAGHYALDCAGHPAVYHATDDPDERKALGRHFRYEAAMDAFSCEKLLGRNINESGQMGIIRLSKQERHVIAHCLHRAISQVYPEMKKHVSARRLNLLLIEYYAISGMLIDPSGFGEWLVLHAEKPLLGYPLTSPLMINNNRYGLDDSAWDRFEPLFFRAVGWLDGCYALLDQALSQKALSDQVQDQALDPVLGRSEEGEQSKVSDQSDEGEQSKVSEQSEAGEQSKASVCEKALFAYVGSRSYHTGKPTDENEKIPFWA